MVSIYSKNEPCLSSSPSSPSGSEIHPNPRNGLINASSQKRLYRPHRKTKTKLKVMFLPG